jgi:hypothetical protein
MAHHKRRRPKNRRAGCRLCKPHKANGAKPFATMTRTAKQEWKAKQKEVESLQESYGD